MKAFSFHDANSARIPQPLKLALNSGNNGKIALDKLREAHPSLKTDEKTKKIEDCVFTNVGGGFASGGTVGASVGAIFGPPGVFVGAALGASAGSISGAVATALDYCCNHHGCKTRLTNIG